MQAAVYLAVAVAAWLVCLNTVEAQAPADPKQRSARQHPYLYFTSDELPALRQRVTTFEPLATRWHALLRGADGHLVRPVHQRLEPRSQLGIVGMCSFAYVITGDARYGERAKAEMFAMLEQDAWHEDLGYNKGVNLGTAECSVAAALFYDWCHDLLSEEERSHFRERALELSTRVYLQSVEQYRDWWVANLVSNWAGVCHGGAGLLALAMYDEAPEAKKAADLARRYVTRFLKSSSHEDGAGHEGIMYWRYGTSFGHYLTSAARKVFGDDDGLYALTAEKLGGYWDVYMLGPDRRYANFNNMDEGTFGQTGDRPGWESGTHAFLNALYEAQVPGGDELLMWAADHGNSAFYWQGACPFYFIFRRPDAPPVPEKPALQEAVLFRGAGHAIFQSPKLWLAYQGGWISDRSHRNFDLGTFVLVANGERYVSDLGYGRTTTGEHSTVLVGGHGQLLGGGAEYMAFGSTPAFHYLASDLSVAYLEPLERFVRHVVMVDGRYVVIFDDLVKGTEPREIAVSPRAPRIPEPDGKEPPLIESTPYGTRAAEQSRNAAPDPAADGAVFQWRLQTRRRIEIAPDGASATFRGEGQMHILPLLPEDGALTLVTVHPPENVRQARRRTPATALALTPGELREREAFLVVLYPDAAGAPAPTARLERAEDEVTLIVDAGGKTDRILFGRADDAWRLLSVNGTSAEAIGRPLERVIRPMRPRE